MILANSRSFSIDCDIHISTQFGLFPTTEKRGRRWSAASLCPASFLSLMIAVQSKLRKAAILFGYDIFVKGEEYCRKGCVDVVDNSRVSAEGC